MLGRVEDPLERFAAVVKSIEVLVTGAIYAGVVAIFSGVTVGLLTALQVKLPPPVVQATFAFLLGLIPVLAVASVYDPGLRPSAQRFGAGVTRIFFIAARLFLPLTLLVLLLVAAILPTRFGVLSENRGTLLIFNAMLFAVMLLIVGATPLRADDLAPRAGTWLRRGIAAVAFAAAVVGAYALAAVLSRTAQGGLTPNRLTVIGWNVVNLAHPAPAPAAPVARRPRRLGARAARGVRGGTRALRPVVGVRARRPAAPRAHRALARVRGSRARRLTAA